MHTWSTLRNFDLSQLRVGVIKAADQKRFATHPRRSNIPPGMHALCAAQFSYWLCEIGSGADNAVGNRIA